MATDYYKDYGFQPYKYSSSDGGMMTGFKQEWLDQIAAENGIFPQMMLTGTTDNDPVSNPAFFTAAPKNVYDAYNFLTKNYGQTVGADSFQKIKQTPEGLVGVISKEGGGYSSARLQDMGNGQYKVVGGNYWDELPEDRIGVDALIPMIMASVITGGGALAGAAAEGVAAGGLTGGAALDAGVAAGAAQSAAAGGAGLIGGSAAGGELGWLGTAGEAAGGLGGYGAGSTGVYGAGAAGAATGGNMFGDDLLSWLDGPAGGGGSTTDWWTSAASPSSNYSLGDLADTIFGTGASTASNASKLLNLLGGGSASSSNLGTLLGGLAGLGGIGSAKQEGTTTTSVEPWKAMQPYLLEAAKQVQGQYNPNLPQEMGTLNSGIQNMANLGMSGAFDPYLNPVMGPTYMDDVAKTVEQRMNRNLSENILPQVRSGAVANGYGSSRQGIAEGLAMRDTQNQINESIAPLYANAQEQYANRLMNNSNQNIAASQAAMQNRLAPYSTAYNSANTNANYGMNQAKNYASTMQGLGGMGSQQSTPYFSNPYGNALGMAQIGTGIWSGLGW